MSLFQDPTRQAWWDSFDSRLPKPADPATVTIPPPASMTDYIADLAMAPVRGVVGIGHGAYQLSDWLSFDSLPDAPDNFGLGSSQTLPGQITEHLTGFLIPFGVIGKGVKVAGESVGLLGRFGRAGRAANALREEVTLARAAGDITRAARAARRAKMIEVGAETAVNTTAAAATQFLFYPGTESNLSSLIESVPSLQNPITEFLATDEDTPELVGRLKSSIEAAIGGIGVDAIFGALRIHRAGARAVASKADADTAMQAEAIQLRREQTEEIRQALNVDDAQASVISAWFDATGLPRSSIAKFQRASAAPEGSPAGTSAWVDFDADSRAIATFLQGADFATALHESSHVLRRWTFNRDIPAELRGVISDADIAAVEEWAGAVDGVWTRAAEEKFANGMLAYMGEGRAPNAALAAMFRKASDLIGSVVDRTDAQYISPKVKGVFDRLMTQGAVKLDEATPAAGISRLYSAPDLTGKPPDVAINIPRVSSLDEARHVVAASLETEMGKAATAFESMGRDEVVYRAVNLLRDNGIMQAGSEAQFGSLLQTLKDGELHTLVQRQHAVRILQDQYAQEFRSATEAVVSAAGADDRTLARWYQTRQRYYAVTAANKEMSVAAGRILQARNIIPDTKLQVTVIPDELLDDAGALSGLLDGAGGRDAMIAEAQSIKAAFNATDYLPDAIARVRKLLDGQRTGVLNMTIEYWMNSLLSGPVTFAANAVSNLFTLLYSPLESAMGNVLTGNINGVRSSFSRYAAMFHSWNDSIAAMKALWKGESAGLIPSSRTYSTLTDSPRKFSISAAGAGLTEESAVGAALNWAGPKINFPTRILSSVDELFKQLNYRSAAYGKLHGEALGMVAEGKLRPSEVGTYIETHMAGIASRRQLYTEGGVKAEAYQAAQRQADAGAFARNSVEFRNAVQAYTAKHWNKKTAEIADSAGELAMEQTFSKPLSTQNGIFEGIAASLQQTVNRYPVLRFFTPFVTVPTRLALYAGQRLPTNMIFDGVSQRSIGFMETPNLKGISRRFSADLSSGDPVRKAEALGRMGMGTMLTGSIFLGAWSGTITGAGPKDPELRKALMLKGWRPYSIKIGDTYVSYRRIDPFATVMGLAADIVEAYRIAEERDQPMLDAALSGLVGAVANNVANKTYLQGMVQVANAITSSERYGGNYVQVFTGSFIPSLLNQTRTLFVDDSLREVRSIADALRNRIPILSEGLDPRRNILGEPLHTPEVFLPSTAGLGGLTLPFAISQESKDPVHQELAMMNHGFSNPKPIQGGIDLTTIQAKPGQTAYDRWLELTGSTKIGGRTLHQSLTKLVTSKAYQSLSSENDFQSGFESPRVAQIRRVLAVYRDAAWGQLLKEHGSLMDAVRVRRQQDLAFRSGKSLAQVQALGAR